MEYLIISYFLLQRFIVPEVIFPFVFPIEHHAMLKRRLIQLIQILHTLANFSTCSTKIPQMQFLNPMLIARQSEMKLFIDEDVPLDDENLDSKLTLEEKDEGKKIKHQGNLNLVLASFQDVWAAPFFVENFRFLLFFKKKTKKKKKTRIQFA